VLLGHATEHVGRIRVAAKRGERLGELVGAAEAQHAQVLVLLGGKVEPALVRCVAEDGGHLAEGEVLGLVHRHDAVVLEAPLARDLKGEDDAQVGHVRARQEVPVALGAVLVLGPVELLPVDAQHGGHLDEVAHGRRGVGLLDAGRHGVPRPLLGLDGRAERVALEVGHLLPRRVLLELARLPLLRVAFHALQLLEEDHPRGLLVVGRVEALLHGRGVGLVVGRGQPRPRRQEALIATVDVGHGGVLDRPLLVGRRADEDDGGLELDLEAELLPDELALLALVPVARDLLPAVRVSGGRREVLLEYLQQGADQGDDGDDQGDEGDDGAGLVEAGPVAVAVTVAVGGHRARCGGETPPCRRDGSISLRSSPPGRIIGFGALRRSATDREPRASTHSSRPRPWKR